MWDGQEGIEEVGQSDSVGLGNEVEHSPVAIKAPEGVHRDDFQGRLPVAVQKFGPQATRDVLIREFYCDCTDPFDIPDRYQPIRKHALIRCAPRKFLQSSHA